MKKYIFTIFVVIVSISLFYISSAHSQAAKPKKKCCQGKKTALVGKSGKKKFSIIKLSPSLLHSNLKSTLGEESSRSFSSLIKKEDINFFKVVGPRNAEGVYSLSAGERGALGKFSVKYNKIDWDYEIKPSFKDGLTLVIEIIFKKPIKATITIEIDLSQLLEMVESTRNKSRFLKYRKINFPKDQFRTERIKALGIEDKVFCIVKCLGLKALGCLKCGTDLECWAKCLGMEVPACLIECLK